MKNYVADANVLFAALISGKLQHVDFFARYLIFTTDFAFIELEKYRQVILKKSKLTEEDRFEFAVRLFSYVTVLLSLSLPASRLEQAYDWCEGIDTKDVLYVALTLQLTDAMLITRDVILHDGL
jgi:predicted nucleic acid-binding protein